MIRFVLSRGGDLQTAEDIAQEVALRAMNHGVAFHDLDDFCVWARRVARNLYIDHARAQGRLVGLLELADRSDGRDVHVEVEKRMVLSRTLRAMEDLDPSDRLAIVDGVNETLHATRKAAVRSAVRRHRARARLLRIVEGIAAFWALVRASRRTVVVAPATVAVCSVLMLPAVVKHLDGPGDAGAPYELGLPHRGGVPPQADRQKRDLDMVQVAVSTGTVRPAVAPPASRPTGPAGGGARPIVTAPGGQPLITQPPPDQVPKNCHVFIGTPPSCLVPKVPPPTVELDRLVP